MKLEDLGYYAYLQQYKSELLSQGFEAGRVIAEHKERYVVGTEQGEVEAEISGHLRYSAENREDFPAVGDWVALTVYQSGISIIHQILPRFSMICRKDVEHHSDRQVIAANIDFALLVQALDRDFNINRLERYLTICNASGVAPIIILTKTDLLAEQRLEHIQTDLQQRTGNIPLVALSSETRKGYEALINLLEKGKTYCMLGSSGVGKSTLLNNLSGRKMMRTDAISQSTSKGKHVTTHRELTVLDNGSLLIDNPGMREVGLADTQEGLQLTFDKIVSLSEHCRFRDCTHTTEQGCAVIQAVESGEIDRHSYGNYLKMKKEQDHFESSLSQRRKKEKDFGKMVRNFKKNRGNKR